VFTARYGLHLLNIIKTSRSVVGFKKDFLLNISHEIFFIFTNVFYETSLQFFYKVTELVNRIKSASQQHVTSQREGWRYTVLASRTKLKLYVIKTLTSLGETFRLSLVAGEAPESLALKRKSYRRSPGSCLQ